MPMPLPCGGCLPDARASPEALTRRTAAVPPLGGYRSEVRARRMTAKAEESPHDCKPNPGTSPGRPVGLHSAVNAAGICSGTSGS